MIEVSLPAHALRLHVALPPDDDVYNELVSTTETKTQGGYVAYHPAKRDDDHNTDAARAMVMAIVALLDEDDVEEEPDFGYGWVSIEGGATWTPPWGS